MYTLTNDKLTLRILNLIDIITANMPSTRDSTVSEAPWTDNSGETSDQISSYNKYVA